MSTVQYGLTELERLSGTIHFPGPARGLVGPFSEKKSVRNLLTTNLVYITENPILNPGSDRDSRELLFCFYGNCPEIPVFLERNGVLLILTFDYLGIIDT